MAIELIAECSSNHGGDLKLAKEFIKRFADAGADWVKFQTTRVAHLNPADPQYAWFKQAELSDAAHFELQEECVRNGVKFLTTIYNIAEIPLIKRLGLEAVKLGSGELQEFGLLLAALDLQIRVLRSVPAGLTHPWLYAGEDILVTVARYPASQRACAAAIEQLRTSIITPRMIGYSDHSIGLEMARWALDCGARVIEKHVCLTAQKRPIAPYEVGVVGFKDLRRYADDHPDKFRGRWKFA